MLRNYFSAIAPTRDSKILNPSVQPNSGSLERSGWGRQERLLGKGSLIILDPAFGLVPADDGDIRAGHENIVFSAHVPSPHLGRINNDVNQREGMDILFQLLQVFREGLCESPY